MAEEQNGTREDAASKRLYCAGYAGMEVMVRQGWVRFDKRGFVVGMIKTAGGGIVDPPQPISKQQKRKLEELAGLVELSAEEVRHLPLQIENERRRRESVERIAECIHTARRRLERWPSIREVQATLVECGFAAGRKEKISEQLQLLKNERRRRNSRR